VAGKQVFGSFDIFPEARNILARNISRTSKLRSAFSRDAKYPENSPSIYKLSYSTCCKFVAACTRRRAIVHARVHTCQVSQSDFWVTSNEDKVRGLGSRYRKVLYIICANSGLWRHSTEAESGSRVVKVDGPQGSRWLPCSRGIGSATKICE